MDGSAGKEVLFEPDVAAQLPTEPIDPVADGTETPVDEVLQRFWHVVRRLPRYLQLAGSMVIDDAVPVKAKAALITGGAYTISPIDFVPGIIPVAGQLDDLIVMLLAIRFAIDATPKSVMASHLVRAGINADQIDEDVSTVKETLIWVVGKALAATVRFVTWSMELGTALAGRIRR